MKKLLLILFIALPVLCNAQLYGLQQNFNGGTTLTEGLISVWEFNETVGTTAFDSHGITDGTNVGVGLQHSTVNNLVFSYFTGISDYVGDLVSFNGMAAFTISMWAKTASTAGTRPMMAKWHTGNTSVLTRISSGNVDFFTKNASSTQVGGTFLTLSDANWHHYVFTYNGSTMRVYFDGVLDATSFSQTGTILDQGTSDSFVGTDGGGVSWFNGWFDQPAVWNRGLIGGEVTLLWGDGDGLAHANW